MDESNPIVAFLKGCCVGFLLLFFAVGSLIFGLVLFFEAQNGSERGTPLGILEFIGALGLIPLGLYTGWMLIKKTRQAFLDQQPQYGAGLLALIVIPLLFFGACTMSVIK